MPPELRTRREVWVDRDTTFAAMFADPKAKIASIEELIAAMAHDGVDRSVAMGIGWTDPGLAREANDYIIEAARSHPERVVGFCSVNPAWGDDAAREIDRCARLGLRGIGEFHPDTQGFDLGDASTMSPVLEVAAEHSLTITTHSSEPVGHIYPGKGRTGPQTLMRFIEAAGAYPEVRIICAHWGGGLPFYALMPEVRDALSNVWFDTAASPLLYTPAVFSTAAQLVGPDKVLLASDYPLVSFGRIRRQIEQAGMTCSDFPTRGPI